MKRDSVEHSDFGKLEWDEPFERYSITVGEGSEAIAIGFHESDRERLESLLLTSAKLWRAREQWFVQWRIACFDY